MYKDRKCGDCKHYILQSEGSGDQEQTSMQKKTKHKQTYQFRKYTVKNQREWQIYQADLSTGSRYLPVTVYVVYEYLQN
jgi:hypothetical protein